MIRFKSFQRVAIYTLLSFGAAVMLFPMLWMLITAFKSEADIYTMKFWPTEWRWDNFVTAWTRAPFTRFTINSFWAAGVTTVAAVGTSALAGYAFAFYRFRGRQWLLLLVLATLMIPPQVTMIPTFLLLAWLRLLDTYAGLILPGIATGFGVFLMRQFFITLPRDLVEAGRIDGGSELRIFAFIMFPLARPAWATLGAFAFLASWNNFLWPLIVLDSESLFTLPIGLLRFSQQFGQEFQLIMAVSTLMLIPSLGVFLLCQKSFVSGIATSGLKG